MNHLRDTGDMFQVIDVSGRLTRNDVDIDESIAKEIHRLMYLSRTFDRRALAMQRQGRIGTYPPLEGQEAVQVGSALALGPDDWIYPSYREHGVQLARGMPAETILAYWRGVPNPSWNPSTYRMGLIAVPIASQLPHAVGHAYQQQLAGNDIVVATYFGDGATSETDFHAGMNFAGVWGTPNVFICSNNLYAISVPLDKQTAAATLADKALGYGIPAERVDGMDPLAVYLATRRSVDRARNGEGPTFIEAVTYRFGPHATADDPSLYRSDEEVAEWRERDPLVRSRLFLESRGVDVDSLEVDAAESVDKSVEMLENAPLPSRRHAVDHTYERPPRALIAQLNRRLAAHGEAAIDRVPTLEDQPTVEPSGPRQPMTMAQAITAALVEGLERHGEAVLLGEDVGVSGGVFRISEGMLERFGPARVIDTPLNESGIVGTAIGMALAGGRPIAEIQFDGFAYPAFDQLVSHLGRLRYRGRGTVSVPVVVRMPNGAGIRAHEHHCDSPEAFFAHAPGLVVVVPSNPFDAKGLLAAAIDSDDPVMFLEPKVLYRAGRADVPTEHYTLPIGRARVRQTGTDVSVVTYGGMVPVVERAAQAAASEGLSVEIIDLRTVYPWDQETVVESVHKTGRLVVVQEPPRTAGIAAEVAATVAEEAAYDLAAPIIRVCGFDAPIPHFAIEEQGLIDEADVIDALTRVVTGE